MNSTSDDKLVRTIRLDDARLEAVLDTLDGARQDAQKNKRASERYSFRVKGCIVHLQQPGNSAPTPFVVATRDISAEGLSFLHGGFVHTRSRCQVQLITTHGAWQNVSGVVVRCRYARDGLHEVGVRFESAIEPADFCEAAQSFRVLLADDDPSIRRLASFLLKQLNAEVVEAENGREAVGKAETDVYDLILMDMEMPVLDGFGAVRELREMGYTGLIVAATALTQQPVDKERCLNAGCDGYIAKPLVREELADLIKSLQQEPLLSSFHDDPSMAELIGEFLMELPAKLRAIEEAFVTEDRKQLETLARSLKGEGGGYGFEPITIQAAKVESAVIDGAPLEQVKTDLKELTRWCLAARSAAKKSIPRNVDDQSDAN